MDFRLILKNPFKPGSGTLPPFLAGRNRHISTFVRILASIEDNHNENVLITGLRGTGKTTLIGKFVEKCLENDFYPIVRSQFSKKYCNPTEFQKAINYDIKKAVESFSKKTMVKGKLIGIGQYLKPRQIGVPGVVYAEPLYHKTPIPFEDELKENLSKNWNNFKKSNFKGVIFLFDEFHTVFDQHKKNWSVLSDFIGALNELQNDGKKYYAVLAGLPNLQINVKTARTYTERMFKSIKVENLTKNDAKDAILIPLKKTGQKFSPSVVTKIISDTSQYPYFIQFFCSEIVNKIDRKNVTDNHYKSIRNEIIEQLDQDFYEPRMEKLGDKEIEILDAMASTKSVDVALKTIANIVGDPSNSVVNYLKRLEQKGMVYNYKRGIYRFSLPLLGDYLLRQSN